MSENTGRFVGLDPVDYINSLLVTEKVRKAYLIQNFESNTVSVDAKIQKILEVFPALKLLQHDNYYFLSLKSLTRAEVNNDEKIGVLLGFSCDVDFKDLDRNKETVTYNINVYLNRKGNPITIITYVCQTKSTLRDAEKLRDDIQVVLTKDRVELDVEVDAPVVSLIPKLIDPKHKFNDKEKTALYNVLLNTMADSSYDKIRSEIDFDNLLHRGIMLSYITEYEHNSMAPFYPLQSTGHMEEVYQIEDKRSDLMERILTKSKKSMKQKGGKSKRKGNRRTRKRKVLL